MPINWNSLEEKLMLGPDVLAEMETTVKKVRQSPKYSQDRKKTYAKKKRSYMEF